MYDLYFKKNHQKINLLVCLGNYDSDYINTRHNSGFEFADFIIRTLGDHTTQTKKSFEITSFLGLNFKILRPTKLMNNSGSSLYEYLKYSPTKSENIAIAFDDLDLKIGTYKIQKSISPRSHNGVNSIELHNDVENSLRIRIGIENRDQKYRIPGMDYVLGKFTDEEKIKLNQVISNIWDEFEIKK